MIDALEAVIAFMATDADLNELTERRIAERHKFASDWTAPSKAVTIRYDGGTPDIYNERQLPRLEIRAYGESPFEAGRVYRALVNAIRGVYRPAVLTNDGKALIYWLVQTSGPSHFIDPDTGVDLVLFFCSAGVAEVDVT